MVASKKIIAEEDSPSVDDGKELTDTEEIIFRSHPEVSVDMDAPLEKKTKNKELLARLHKIEKEAIRRAIARGIIK